jgi:hypothetical protein
MIEAARVRVDISQKKYAPINMTKKLSVIPNFADIFKITKNKKGNKMGKKEINRFI